MNAPMRSRIHTLLFFAASLLSAEDTSKPKAQPAIVNLSETQFLKLENADLKLALMASQQQIAQAARESVMNEVCQELKLDDCQFDLRARTATQTPKPVAPSIKDPSSKDQQGNDDKKP